MATAARSSSAAEGSIRPLDEDVYNRIAAGEVVLRPASAVKEMIENSIDAGATSIVVSFKPGPGSSGAGLGSVLSVSDNGKGIAPVDLLVLCRRFNTSKLRAFEDLKSIQTYGFRGEALASITHVARVTVTSQTADAKVSTRARYADGKILNNGRLEKCAGTLGTTILVEDLFYNVPQRAAALRSASEEYNKLLDVCQKYAIHHGSSPHRGRPGIGVTCRKGVASDLHTSSSNTIQENIATVYGSELARELVPLETTVMAGSCRVLGLISNANYSRRASVGSNFLLFINDRLVESSSLKRAVDVVYAEVLPKGGHPFLYLALALPPDQVDVNVHPTKKEVQFLHHEELCSAVAEEIRLKLQGANASRMFVQQTLVTTTTTTAEDEAGETTTRLGLGAPSEDFPDEPATGTKKRPLGSSASLPRRENKMIRTDAYARRMDEFVVRDDPPPTSSSSRRPEEASPPAPPTSQTTQESSSSTISGSSDDMYRRLREDLDAAPLISSQSDALELESITSMRREIKAGRDWRLSRLLRGAVFVGVVDERTTLIQSETSLYAVDHTAITRELMYQRVLELFGRFMPALVTPQPLNLAALLDATTLSVLTHNAEMLFEYFGVDVRNQTLTSLPRLLAGHLIQPRAILQLLRGLSQSVRWSSADEQLIFHDVARVVGDAYAVLPVFKPLACTSEDVSSWRKLAGHDSVQRLMKQVLFPAWKDRLIPTKNLADLETAAVLEITSLGKLYKVFERC